MAFLKNHLKNVVNVSKYADMVSSFPTVNGWGTTSCMYQYQGFWYETPYLEGVLSAQQHFKAHSNDIIVASSTKTGTTWLKALTFAIATRTTFQEGDSASPLLHNLPHECIPVLEHGVQNESSNRDVGIPLVATHVPYNSLPKTILDSGCKIVYICRDPKDVFVSYWHFVTKILISINVEPLPIEDAFDKFCEGVSTYGPYWDHVLGYWKASRAFPEKILFLKYEELKKDTDFYVKKLAEFMGYPFTSEEMEKGIVEKIIKMCSFENLSNLEVNKSGKHTIYTTVAIENRAYFRNGQVGDWKNHLTSEMGTRLDNIFKQKLSGSGFTFNTSF